MTTQVKLGGGNRYFAETEHRQDYIDPRIERDMALCKRAYDHVVKVAAVKRIKGDPSGLSWSRTELLLRSLMRDKRRRLTDNQVAMCCRILHLDAPPPMPAAKLPAVLQHLPLKPPPTRREE